MKVMVKTRFPTKNMREYIPLTHSKLPQRVFPLAHHTNAQTYPGQNYVYIVHVSHS